MKEACLVGGAFAAGFGNGRCSKAQAGGTGENFTVRELQTNTMITLRCGD